LISSLSFRSSFQVLSTRQCSSTRSARTILKQRPVQFLIGLILPKHADFGIFWCIWPGGQVR